jgi:anti-anti-sigma factor
LTFVEFFVSFVSHRDSVHGHLIIELAEAVDPDTEHAVERELARQLRCCASPVVVIDIRTPLVTSTALHLLLRLRQDVQARDAILCVVARHRLARRVFRLTGLTRALCVTATMSGMHAIARSCPQARFSGGADGIEHTGASPLRSRGHPL